jgi:UDP-N-acetylmuramoyl-L-alanyl-D-glutamate--2,6-diaminopimelate ligase
MKLNEILRTVEFTASREFNGNTDIEELCHDSRRTRENTLFICIKGATVDGHSFAYSAYSRGCRHFVVDLGESF